MRKMRSILDAREKCNKNYITFVFTGMPLPVRVSRFEAELSKLGVLNETFEAEQLK